MTTDEEWKPVEGYDNYVVSSLGRVYNIKHKRFLTGGPNKKGYIKVFLYGETKKCLSMHRLVLVAFRGPSPLEGNHKDGCKSNNRLDNLEYVTTKQNSIHAHKILKIKKARGFNHGNAKLTDEQWESIKNSKTPPKKLAAILGVHWGTVYSIRSGRYERRPQF